MKQRSVIIQKFHEEKSKNKKKDFYKKLVETSFYNLVFLML
ncbi:hypothetical protein AAJ76_413000810 [Vairimorpha ceranae]|uniref:Uncharacterized protein n=1 Tax=Vairimorpha ceranae TaxID=40302 RepID=A0A0F9W9B7_9MICR|nr:hypothetical protein AAJ76_413000810 [Vairimorpha ceranae]KKO73590.1 hypothetical protein AAJ76_413000810 [Vairimorpha ceranae]